MEHGKSYGIRYEKTLPRGYALANAALHGGGAKKEPLKTCLANKPSS